MLLFVVVEKDLLQNLVEAVENFALVAMCSDMKTEAFLRTQKLSKNRVFFLKPSNFITDVIGV